MKKKLDLSSIFAASAIVIIFAVCIALYKFVLGNPANFQGGDPANHPVEGNFLGVIYKGGPVVPVIMSFFLMAITFSIERFITIRSAQGRGPISVFVQKIKAYLEYDQIDEALKECDRQRGSIGNVIKSSILKMEQMRRMPDLSLEQKVVAIEKDLEDSISLEMPMLNRNLPILATLVSIGTLFGLLGTVIGMIRAFAALAISGNPDSTQLANGISEALINTALGIATSALATITYNYFTNRIDTLRYSIDEVGLSLIQTFQAKAVRAEGAKTTKTGVTA